MPACWIRPSLLNVANPAKNSLFPQAKNIFRMLLDGFNHVAVITHDTERTAQGAADDFGTDSGRS
jgi:hypothetical protein